MMHLGPVIHVYSIVWNDEYMLPYFFRHYDPIASKYVLYDNHSSDSSVAIMRQNPKVEIRQIVFDTDSVCQQARELKNSCWKESRGIADWVIVIDVDEHIFHPNMMSFLRRELQAKTTLVKTVGYDMVSEKRPTGHDRLSNLVNTGVPNVNYDKVFFNPNYVDEINYSPGAHWCGPKGIVKYSVERPLLLHYKHLGRQETLSRNRALAERLGPTDKAKGWGFEYSKSEEWFNADFESKLNSSVVVSPWLC